MTKGSLFVSPELDVVVFGRYWLLQFYVLTGFPYVKTSEGHKQRTILGLTTLVSEDGTCQVTLGLFILCIRFGWCKLRTK